MPRYRDWPIAFPHDTVCIYEVMDWAVLYSRETGRIMIHPTEHFASAFDIGPKYLAALLLRYGRQCPDALKTALLDYLACGDPEDAPYGLPRAPLHDANSDSLPPPSSSKLPT